MGEHMNLTNYLLRVMNYEKYMGDKNIVTILYQNRVSNLEVLTKDV